MSNLILTVPVEHPVAVAVIMPDNVGADSDIPVGALAPADLCGVPSISVPNT